MTTPTIEQALREFLSANDPEGFGCACAPESECGPCRTRKSQAPLRAALAAHEVQQTAALLDVAAERRRQIDDERWSLAHDDDHDDGDIAAAGSAYALAAADALHPMSQGDGDFKSNPPAMWPWDDEWWKPSDPRRMLVKAGALILAEIERLDRKETP